MKNIIRYLKEEADPYEKFFYSVVIFGLISPFIVMFIKCGIYVVESICFIILMVTTYLHIKDRSRRYENEREFDEWLAHGFIEKLEQYEHMGKI